MELFDVLSNLLGSKIKTSSHLRQDFRADFCSFCYIVIQSILDRYPITTIWTRTTRVLVHLHQPNIQLLLHQEEVRRWGGGEVRR